MEWQYTILYYFLGALMSYLYFCRDLEKDNKNLRNFNKVSLKQIDILFEQKRILQQKIINLEFDKEVSVTNFDNWIKPVKEEKIIEENVVNITVQ